MRNNKPIRYLHVINLALPLIIDRMNSALQALYTNHWSNKFDPTGMIYPLDLGKSH
jgi:hypothetical protein